MGKAFLLVSYLELGEGDDPSMAGADWNAATEKDRADIARAIRPVLAALADAGLLVAPGGDPAVSRTLHVAEQTAAMNREAGQ